MSPYPEKIAVFGSAFNPPTLGHLSVIERLFHFDSVLLIPSIFHAWGKTMADYSERCAMVELFIQDIPCSNVTLSRIEQELFDGSHPVTTFQLLEKIQEKYPDADITFVVGPDNFFQFDKFAHAQEILERWTVMASPQTTKIRSTLVRKNLQTGKEIANLTTNQVAHHLQNSELYTKIDIRN